MPPRLARHDPASELAAPLLVELCYRVVQAWNTEMSKKRVLVMCPKCFAVEAVCGCRCLATFDDQWRRHHMNQTLAELELGCAPAHDTNRGLVAEPFALEYRAILLGAVCSLRQVCRHWRDSITYTCIRSLCLGRSWHEIKGPAPAASVQLNNVPITPDRLPRCLAAHFSACVSLDLTAVFYLEELPLEIRAMPSLRALSLGVGACFEMLPDWFASLPLTSLSLACTIPMRTRMRSAGAIDLWNNHGQRVSQDETRRKGRHDRFATWLTSSTCRLPTSLEGLILDSFTLTEMPPVIRLLTNLRALTVKTAFEEPLEFQLPQWLGELHQLKSLGCLACDMFSEKFNYAARNSANSAGIICHFHHLEHLDICYTEWEIDDATLNRIFAPTCPFMTTLRHLVVCVTSTELPTCFRRLTGLQILDLSFSSFESLPEWIGELPLVELGLSSVYSIDTLPVSLRSTPTLRWLDLTYTKLGDLEEQSVDPQTFAVALAIMRRELLPLAAANPDLNFKIDNATELVSKVLQVGVQNQSWWSPRLMPSFLDDATWAGLFHVSSDSDEEEEEEEEEDEEEEGEED